MSLRVEFLSGADADLQEIFNRFEEIREGFGVEFLVTLDAYLTRVSAFPEMAPIYFERTRRQIVRKFPYGIFYEPQKTRILVFAILDLRQDEAQIRKRIRAKGDY